MSAAAAGTGLSWTSPVLDQLKSENSTIPTTDGERTWIGSCLPIGALIGAIPAGILADKIGRKQTTITIAIPFIVSWLLTVFAKNVWMLYIARILIGTMIRNYNTAGDCENGNNCKLFRFSGISTGASCVVAPVFISEFAETSIRGTLGTCFQLFLTMGILLVYAVGAVTNWIVLSWVCMALPVILLVGLFFIPESPVWLLKNVSKLFSYKSPSSHLW